MHGGRICERVESHGDDENGGVAAIAANEASDGTIVDMRGQIASQCAGKTWVEARREAQPGWSLRRRSPPDTPFLPSFKELLYLVDAT